MTLKSTIETLLQQTLKEKPSLFLIDLRISSSNVVTIRLDGDEGVTLQDCIDISKSIDSQIDPEAYDFSLEVASCGAESPIKLLRQLPKNINRTFSLTIDDVKFDAVLKAINGDLLAFEWEAREPKKTGKGKETVAHKKEIRFDTIQEMKVKITFN